MVYLCLTPTICDFADITPKMTYGRSQREQKIFWWGRELDWERSSLIHIFKRSRETRNNCLL